jgi:SIR2-like domain
MVQSSDELSKLIQRVSSGEAILFVGAGFSKGAINNKKHEFPSARELSKEIAALAGIQEDDDDLRYVTEYYIQNGGTEKLIELLKETFTTVETAEHHQIISAINWMRIYTTNYDDVVENAARKNSKWLKTITVDDDPKEFYKLKNLCIHINGSIGTLSKNTLQNKFKLSKSSYMSPDSFSESAWYYSFKKDLERCSAIVFVGYSLYDIDIEKVLFNCPDYKEKTFFITQENPSQKSKFQLSNYGSVLTIGAENFAENLKYLPLNTEIEEIWTEAFVRFKILDSQNDSISDNQIQHFLLYGRIDEEYINLAISGTQEKPYLVVREIVNDVVEKLNKKHFVVLHSELGNGKTIILKQIASHLYLSGKKVYFLENDDGDYAGDIDRLLAANDESVLIIDGYSRHIDTIRYFMQVNPSKICLLVSDRTINHESQRNFLHNTQKEIYEYNIDTLIDQECNQFCNIISNIGGWNHDAGLSNFGKAEYIKKHFKNQISQALLGLLQSPIIKDKISALLIPVFKNEKLKDTVFAICLLEIMGFSLRRSLISQVSDSDEIYLLSTNNHSSFQELFKLEGDIISTKCSVFSIYLIKNHFSAPYVTNQLLKIVRKFDTLQDNGSTEKSIFKLLLRFSFVERVLPDENKRDSLIKFYENLKIQVSWLTKSPHFWLQYAMARITFNELDQAQKYLNQAYSIVEQKEKFDTAHLDAQQARLYLKNSINCESENDVFTFFSDAHKLLSKLNNDSYKFRQVIAYREFFDLKYQILSKRHRVDFEHACKKMLNDLKSYNTNFSTNGETIFSKSSKALNSILESIQSLRNSN